MAVGVLDFNLLELRSKRHDLLHRANGGDIQSTYFLRKNESFSNLDRKELKLAPEISLILLDHGLLVLRGLLSGIFIISK